MEPGRGKVAVWDPLVRIGHWMLLAGFATAYVTKGKPIAVHTWAGYTVAGIVLFRILWGFIGPRHARFGSFICSPAQVLGYLRDLVSFRARRYLGHSPAGGAMTIALLLTLAGTVTTGMLTYGDEKHAGPLAFFFPAPPVETAPANVTLFPSLDEEADEPAGAGPGRREESVFVEVHETFVNLTLLLAIMHVGGVALASFAHRENLVRAMVTGRKRVE